MKLQCVIFDMDGTVVDVSYDWKRIKEELMTRGKPILAYLNSLKEPERSENWKVLENYENEATQNARLKKGMREFLNYLSVHEVKKALVTNNSQKNVSLLLKKFDLVFDLILSRESGFWKPSGAPFLEVLKKLELQREECCVVGDSHFDVKAANDAGIPLVFILNEDKERFASLNAEIFSSVSALKKRIEDLLKNADG